MSDFNLLETLKQHGSVNDVAKKLGINRVTLYDIAKGKQLPSTTLYWQIADLLGMSCDELRAYLEQ